jgi:drug/metabolite transporter (DMT)-like permease
MSIYREKLWPAWWLFVATALVIPASLLVFVPINFTTGVIVAIVLYTGCCVALLLGAPLIEVTNQYLRAGRATLPIEAVGVATAFRGDEARLQRGQQLDARAWLMIRGWVAPVATVTVVDEEDPTPYWLLSTRNPEALAAAIAQAKTGTANAIAR